MLLLSYHTCILTTTNEDYTLVHVLILQIITLGHCNSFRYVSIFLISRNNKYSANTQGKIYEKNLYFPKIALKLVENLFYEHFWENTDFSMKLSHDFPQCMIRLFK